MSNPIDPTLRELNDCGCCAGIGSQTPADIENRPGLAEVSFRAGIHSQFKATLLAKLSSQDHAALSQLYTRESDDFTIALLDAFAGMADVLTFYSERIANEAYLRTATERRSLLELARAVGYELAPGVAAACNLSFTVEGGRGASGIAIIPKGTKVQSIPGPGEKPQTFETSLEFVGRAAWNELRPRLRSNPLSGKALLTASDLFLAGTSTNLRPGDVLVLSNGNAARACHIAAIVADRELGHTKVVLEADEAGTIVPIAPIIAPIETDFLVGQQPTVKTVGERFLTAGVSSHELFSLGHFQQWDLAAVQIYLNNLPKISLPTPDTGVFAMRARLGIFGHIAPKWESLPRLDATRNDAYPEDWDDLDALPPIHGTHTVRPTTIWQDSQGNDLVARTGFDILLDRSVQEVIKGGWVVLETARKPLLPLRVGLAADVSRADYSMSAKCTGLQLLNVDGTTIKPKDEVFKTRTTSVYAQSEPQTLIGAPIETLLRQGDTELELDRIDKDLKVGQALALKGENADLPKTTQREIVVIVGLRHSDVTTLSLTTSLHHNYIRATVTLNGNVVPATHGETTEEVLGSGDATLPFQRFILKRMPLTFAFPDDASGLRSSLEIWVDDLKWREVATFYDCGPKDRIYIVRRFDDGTTMVQFGDGRRGSRLPSGRENIRALYRTGIGLEGLVKEEQLSLLLTQPLGVKGVSNLLKPEGAEDPQSLDNARVNAPRTLLTLDRIVSLQDCEDFSRDFPGVEKAHAVWTWSSQDRGVLLTLLGPDGRTIGDTGQTANRLRESLSRQGFARVPVRIVSRPPSLFSLTGVVRVENDRLPTVVKAAVRDAMLNAFSFEAREFGRGVHLGEVLAVIQNVPGVAFIEATALLKTFQEIADGPIKTIIADENGYLAAHLPANGVDSRIAEPAELLIFDETSLATLEVNAS